MYITPFFIFWVIVDFFRSYLFYIVYIFLFCNIFYAFVFLIVNKKNTGEGGELIYDTKRLNGGVYYPYELILDIYFSVTNKYIKFYDVLSFIIFSFIFSFVEFVLLLFIFIFLSWNFYYSVLILKGLIFGDDVELKIEVGKTRRHWFFECINIIKTISFNVVYFIISGSALKVVGFRAVAGRFIVSRVYGKSMLMINMLVIVYRCIKDSLKSVDWVNKKWFVWPVIFLAQFFIEIDYRVEKLHKVFVSRSGTKRIIIVDRKLRLNPNTLAKEIFKVDKLIMKRILGRIIISNKYLDGVNINKECGTFHMSTLKKKEHLVDKLSNLKGGGFLVKSLSTKKDVSISIGKTNVIKAGNPIMSNSFEDHPTIQEKQEKFSYYAIVSEDNLKGIKNTRILDYYTNNNSNFRIFFDLQLRIRFLQDVENKNLDAIKHNSNSFPTSIVGGEDVFKSLEDRNKVYEEIRKLNEAVEKETNFSLKKYILNTSIGKNVSDLDIDESLCDIKNILYSTLKILDVHSFQDMCAESIAITRFPNEEEFESYADLIQSIKKLS